MPYSTATNNLIFGYTLCQFSGIETSLSHQTSNPKQNLAIPGEPGVWSRHTLKSIVDGAESPLSKPMPEPLSEVEASQFWRSCQPLLNRSKWICVRSLGTKVDLLISSLLMFAIRGLLNAGLYLVQDAQESNQEALRNSTCIAPVGVAGHFYAYWRWSAHVRYWRCSLIAFSSDLPWTLVCSSLLPLFIMD